MGDKQSDKQHFTRMTSPRLLRIEYSLPVGVAGSSWSINTPSSADHPRVYHLIHSFVLGFKIVWSQVWESAESVVEMTRTRSLADRWHHVASHHEASHDVLRNSTGSLIGNSHDYAGRARCVRQHWKAPLRPVDKVVFRHLWCLVLVLQQHLREVAVHLVCFILPDWVPAVIIQICKRKHRKNKITSLT